MSDTPETDALEIRMDEQDFEPSDKLPEYAKLCRKLERERDELIARPDYRQKFLAMRRSCRAANRGAERNAQIISNLTNELNRLRSRDQTDYRDLMELRQENRALNTVLFQTLKRFETLNLENDRALARRKRIS